MVVWVPSHRTVLDNLHHHSRDYICESANDGADELATFGNRQHDLSVDVDVVLVCKNHKNVLSWVIWKKECPPDLSPAAWLF